MTLGQGRAKIQSDNVSDMASTSTVPLTRERDPKRPDQAGDQNTQERPMQEYDSDESHSDMFARLDEQEEFWRDHTDLLESRGYRLRPRYRPGWVASWTVKNVERIRCEDFISLNVSLYLRLFASF